MIKTNSILLLSTLFIISTSPMCSGVKPPQKHATVVPATGAAAVNAPDSQTKGDSSPTATALGTSVGLSATTAAIAVVAATGTVAAIATACAAKASTTNVDPKGAIERRKITLRDLITRESSIFNVLPTSANKKIYGAHAVVLSALNGLRKSEETLDCQESDTQAQLGSAVQAIIQQKNLSAAEELLRLANINEIFLDKTYRENLRSFIKSCQQTDEASFQEEYNRDSIALQEKLKKHIAKSKSHDALIDGTYRLGGKRNLTDEELAYLQGNKSKLTKEQQMALTRKQTERQRAGLSDNEEEHPEFVDPLTIIKIPASQLSLLKPGSNSLRAVAVPAAAAAAAVK